MLAARKEAPKDSRYEPSARALETTCRNSLQDIEAAMKTSAASGSSTSALRKNVVNPNVSPNPGRTLGWRIAVSGRATLPRATLGVPELCGRRARRTLERLG